MGQPWTLEQHGYLLERKSGARSSQETSNVHDTRYINTSKNTDSSQIQTDAGDAGDASSDASLPPALVQAFSDYHLEKGREGWFLVYQLVFVACNRTVEFIHPT